MKNVFLKSMMVLTFVLAAIYGKASFAHDYGGALGTAAGATDLLMVNCYADAGGTTARLGIQVLTAPPGTTAVPQAIKVSVRTQKDKKATNSTDPVNNDSVSSPITYNNGGDGAYYVTVTKTTTGAVKYALGFHCQSSTGAHTGTDDPYVIQNQ